MVLQANQFPQFSAVGFTIHHQIEFERLLKFALERGTPVPTLTGKYIAWRPGNGPELWVKVRDRKIIACTPSYSGEGMLRVQALSLHARTEGISDGALRGSALPEDAASAPYPIVVDIPGFEALAARLVLPQSVQMQATAFAQQMRCSVPADGSPTPTETLTFPGFTGSADLPDGVPAATVQLGGRVLKAEMRTNPVTNQNFLALVVRVPGGGTVDVTADPQTASGELAVGGLIAGTFWLSGRVLESPPDAPEAPQKSGPAPVLSRLTHWVRGGQS